MAPLSPGTAAPPIADVELGGAPRAVFFYKVTCPVCQMAAPKAGAMATAYPDHFVGVGQDAVDKLAKFALEFDADFASVADVPPYEASNAYGVETVPTLFVVNADGTIVETVESWDREGYNRASKTLADLTGLPYAEASNAADGLPAFRPG